MVDVSKIPRGLTRRRLLWLLAGLAGVVSGGVAWLRRQRPPGDAASRGARASGAERPAEPVRSPGNAALIAQLRGHFDYLEIDDAALSRFADDHQRHRGRFVPGAQLPPKDRVRFLMSTDFFQNGADESRRLHYVMYYDPYVSPCYNPLVRRA
jgi:hypothetical protein